MTCPGDATREDIGQLIDALREQGFIPENTAEDDANVFVIEMPKAGFSATALDNLQKIIASKAGVFKKAIRTDMLEVVATADTLRFPWFTLHGLDGEADAYNKLVSALCKMANNQKRVTAKECASSNEKFTMRLFLIRLGFVGNEYKTARRILLRNLTGNSNWKSGYAPERSAETLPAAQPEITQNEEGGAPYAE